MDRLLITGGAGGLGKMARARLGHMAKILRISDIAELDAAGPNEEVVRCDLSDKASVDALVEGCDGIVHFGGKSVEGPWSVVRQSNIEGVYNLYEAARAHGHPRILFASSNHAIGFYKQTETIDAHVPTRPDSLYGVSKVFGEAIASMYYDKFGQETAIVRIGSSFPEPINHRMLKTWLSYADFVRLIERVFDVPKLGCPIIYGVSDNSETWWDNHAVDFLEWSPKDSSEVFRAKIDENVPKPASDAPDVIYQGGMFCADDIHEDRN